MKALGEKQRSDPFLDSKRRSSVIALRKEECGVLVMELWEHVWPDDLELADPVVHYAAQSRQNPLLLLVEVATDFDTSAWAVLYQFCSRGYWLGIVPPELQC